jgi:hypothetical protein
MRSKAVQEWNVILFDMWGVMTLQCITNSSLKSSLWFTMPVAPALIPYKHKVRLWIRWR